MDFTMSYEAEELHVIQACMRQERWAQKRLYEEYFGQMIGVCMRFTHSEDEARDMVHDGFLKVFSNIRKYKIGSSMGAWMRRIMINTCIDEFRKQKTKRTEMLEEAGNVVKPERNPIDSFTENEILNAVQQLPYMYRSVFNLFVVEGYSHREIAELLEINESTSRSNLVKARHKLRASLKNLYPEHVRSK
jgi:RNA polymerase sigma factor (sigma-70 family)